MNNVKLLYGRDLVRPLRTQNFALILAAGFSTRMGTCKTTLPWLNNRTLLQYQAEQFLLAGITPIVVLGAHNAHQRCNCPHGSLVAINFHSDRGKTSSILTGLKTLPAQFSTLTISAVDQPRPTDVYQSLLQAHQQAKALITAPCHEGKLGHPLLFSQSLLPALKQINEANLGLREIVQKLYFEINRVNFETSEVLIDLNNQKTYQLEILKASYKELISR